jgi:rRNA-processing protein FCF1
MAFDWLWRDKIHKTVILDTSAILSFFEFSIDWEKELFRLLDGYKIMIPNMVINELTVLSQQTASQRKQKAAASLRFAKRYETIETVAGNADDAVIEAAKKMHGVVVTNDTELRKRLSHDSIPVIFLRGKKRFALEE